MYEWSDSQMNQTFLAFTLSRQLGDSMTLTLTDKMGGKDVMRDWTYGRNGTVSADLSQYPLDRYLRPGQPCYLLGP